uniref:Uncharacterized protein n=1 Tax=Plectus sambesii TaxID=2011161 RepID=A0A914WY22_9BILA
MAISYAALTRRYRTAADVINAPSRAMFPIGVTAPYIHLNESELFMRCAILADAGPTPNRSSCPPRPPPPFVLWLTTPMTHLWRHSTRASIITFTSPRRGHWMTRSYLCTTPNTGDYGLYEEHTPQMKW